MIHVPKLSTVSTFQSALDLHRNPFQPEKNSITFPISYICVNGRTILWQIWLIYFIDKHLTKLYKTATSAVWKLDKFGYIKKKSQTSTLEYFKLRKRKNMAKAFIFAICVALFWSTGKYFLFYSDFTFAVINDLSHISLCSLVSITLRRINTLLNC